ncbi:MAG: hypothetical protein GSR81_02050 [Desulfurococcales archaeon]|nr:hypothetical protein [Desulfurococcales archaeon]
MKAEKLSKRSLRCLARILIKEYEKAMNQADENLYTRAGVVNLMKESTGDKWRVVWPGGFEPRGLHQVRTQPYAIIHTTNMH